MTNSDLQDFMSSSQQSVETFAPVAVYRFKHYKPQTLFDQVLYMLIRPPRFVYNEKLLIPAKKYKQKFQYEIHQIPFPISIYWAEKPKYIILYLHGNSSSRFQGYLHLKELPQGACLACFDFNGCGLRKEGKYITLGKQQSIEVDRAIQFLQSYGLPIAGWGRSMGSVSLLMSKKCDIMIADSPFSSLYDLCKETSLNFLPSCLCCLVHCIFPCIFCCVRSGVQKKSGMDPNQIQVIKSIQNQPTYKHILIMAGLQDSMISYTHSKRLYKSFKGKNKRIVIFEGGHNSNRPSEVIQECFQFIQSAIQNLKSLQIIKNQGNYEQTKSNKNGKRVLKIQRSTSKIHCEKIKQQSMNGFQQTQTTKDNLILKSKSQVQHKNIKLSPTKKPLPQRNTTEPSFQQCEKIQIPLQKIRQRKQSIQQQVRQAIGKFQQDLNKKQQIYNGKTSFKQILKNNGSNNFSQNNSINLTKIQMQKSNKKSRQKLQKKFGQQELNISQYDQQIQKKDQKKSAKKQNKNNIVQSLKLNLKNIKPRIQGEMFEQFKQTQGDEVLADSQSHINVMIKQKSTKNFVKLQNNEQNSQTSSFNVKGQDNFANSSPKLLNTKYYKYPITTAPSPKYQDNKEKNLQPFKQVSLTCHLSKVEQSDIKILNQSSKFSTRNIEIKSIQRNNEQCQANNNIEIISRNNKQNSKNILDSIQSNIVQNSQTSQIRRDQMFSKMKQSIIIKQSNIIANENILKSNKRQEKNSQEGKQSSIQIQSQNHKINKNLQINPNQPTTTIQIIKQIVTIQQIN